jgi:signal transduction histidine kinase
LRATGTKLGRALNDVLDWVALTQPTNDVTLGPVDPRDWAKLTYESVRARARDLDVACDLGLDVPEGLRIMADAGRLHRMTNALLVHALSAAGQGGRVGFSVGIRGLDESSVELAIAVSANGPAPGAARSNLGGAVAQGFAHALGGTIEHREAAGGTLDVFRAGFTRAA